MKRLIYFSAITGALILSACGDSTTTNSNNTASNRPANVNSTGNGVLTPTTPTPEATTNNAPTLTPIYKAYCAAWVKKDEEALRKIYSSDTIADFEFHTVRNEAESLLLEGKLIKDYRPRYNVAFRDDKRFLLVKLQPSAKVQVAVRFTS